MRLLRAFALFELGAWVGTLTSAALAKRALRSRGDADSDEVALVAILDGTSLKSTSQAFRGGSLFAWFGGVALDLREAKLAPEARLSAHSLFGGVAVRVPEGWRVEADVTALLGGFAKNVPEPDDPDAPTLAVEGFALFGGIAVGGKPDDFE
jgi:Cell wall-active antibiotics response 4TMS YvqF